MALPSRKQQIERVIELLELSEEKTLVEIAETLVDGYLDLMGSSIKKPMRSPLKGEAFKHPALSGVWHVAYELDETVWIISATTKYGGEIRTDSDFWLYAESSAAKAGAPGDNKDGWKAGDKVSRRQRQFIYKILEVGDKCVLMSDTKTGMTVTESNENLKQYYRKEIEMGKIDW